jgi:RING finger and CHY zinc finger domain-containing protein 1
MDDNDFCLHYDRNCLIFSNCCNKYYACRLCHDMYENHILDRFKINKMKCLKCNEIQDISQYCIKCNNCMGIYFCKICNLFDNNGEIKKIFHCNDCGICRIGGKDNFYHCNKCEGCISIKIKDNHNKCIEKSFKDNCSICLEDIFNSRSDIYILNCNHIFHKKCLFKVLMLCSNTCPICRTEIIQF